MSSMFDSEVYQRRKATPCTQISLFELMRNLALEAPDGALVDGKEVTLKVRYRPDVATRFWWTLRWWNEEGEHIADAQELQLCLWRAATMVAHEELEKAGLHRGVPRPTEKPPCICAQGVTHCPKHGEQPEKRGLCPKCGAVLGYCAEGEYCTSETCNYAY